MNFINDDYEDYGYKSCVENYEGRDLQTYISKKTFEDICKLNKYFANACSIYKITLEDYRLAIKTCEYMLLMANIWEMDSDSFVRKTAELVINGCRKILLDDVVSITEEEHKSMMGAMRKAEARVASYDKHEAFLIRESSRRFFTKINPVYSKSCYIATAVYGSYDKEEVYTLRKFRDQYLLKSNIGKKFVKWYYINSPIWVNKHLNNNVLNRILKIHLDLFVKILRIIMPN